ncbi:hypothetical protein F0562_001116 [Nyssa sinensis]|uniref:Glycosyl transferase CAP10 domain-containing protein n=1 Tax=Nyssa sinensis TaxID=561372 RepID=A0A5J5C702_9ASTE|nr:hypothetical protein F0562_001116 [Nyssa sinensis]
MFTIWGLLQLLRRYPGMVPDVDLMFECMDKPNINRTEHQSMPLPLFRYCTTPDHFDIPFPDWSFWGWPEINIGPWDEEFRSIKQGSQARSSGEHKLCVRIGKKKKKMGLRSPSYQINCNHRYKIYAEGYAWSVSLKYIVSCGSLSLIISPQYEDFFSRGLVPKKNYWPVSPDNLCRSIKYVVEWGNAHLAEAETIGKGGQDFMESLSMDRVYDYMYHLITEYSKLLDFKPVQPSSAEEVCLESMFCFADEKERQFLQRSTSFPSPSPPCTLQPPDSDLIKNLIETKKRIINNVQNLM